MTKCAPVDVLVDDGMPPLVAFVSGWESGRNGTGSPNLGGGGTGLLAFAGLGAGGGILGRGGAEDAAARAAPLHAHMIHLGCTTNNALQKPIR